MAARRQLAHQPAVGGGVAVAPGGGDRQAEDDDAQRALDPLVAGTWTVVVTAVPLQWRCGLRARTRAAPRGARRCARRAPARRAAWPMARAACERHRATNDRDLVAVARDQHLPPGLEEQLDALPGVGDEAGAGAGRLEDPRGRREAVAGHAVAADVEHRRGRAVEGVVVARVDMAEIARRCPGAAGRPSRCRRAGSSRRRQRCAAAEEELLDPRLAVGQPVAEEARGRRRSAGPAAPG